MMLGTWWHRPVHSKVQFLRCPRQQRRRLRSRYFRPEVVFLEERCVPAVILGGNFAGLDFLGSGFVPPSPQVAVGPNHVVEVVNSQLAIYTKTGTRLSAQSLTSFFNSGSPTPFSPVAVYDELANRFVVGVLQRDQSTQSSFFYLAVSNSSDPTAGFAEQQKINVQQTPLQADFPRLGWNADAYVVTFNMFSFSGTNATYVNTQLLTIAKATVLDGNPNTLSRFQFNRANQFSLTAAALHGSVAGDPLWLVRSGGGGSNAVQVTRMTNFLSATPSFTDFILTVPAYAEPPDAAQLGSNGLLETNDARILSAVVRGNRLVATHNVGTGGVARARWYDFNLSSGLPALTQSGEINPGASVHTYYPAIEIAANGELGMTYLQSSSSEFLSMYITGRTSADPVGTMQTPVLVRGGQAAYSDFTNPFSTGHYSGISLDPSSTTTFWAANEFATNATPANWGTWIANFNVTSGPGGGTISGVVFHDVNANTVRDTNEPGLQGWTIFLDNNSNDALDAGEPSTLTDASGNFSFTNLVPGTYKVREVLQVNWVRTTPNPADIPISSGSNVTNITFGNFSLTPVTGTISGLAFHDLNGNGTRDANEPAQQGWTLFLDSNNNGTLDAGEPSTTTDASGNYTFPNLSAATYKVREVTQTGWVRTTTNPADIVLSVGSNVPGINFGNFQQIAISGAVFNDLNANTVRDANEPGLQGWTIFLDNNGNDTLDAGEPSATTDASGTFSFPNLGPATYRVREVLQANWVRTTANPANSVASSGSNVTGILFGNVSSAPAPVPGTISGQAFHDLNGNGNRDTGEGGLQGRTIFLDSNNNGVRDSGELSTTTDASGNYTFANLLAGTYRVREALPTGWVRTTSNPADITFSSSGGNVTGVNLGDFQLISISGQVFHDLNGNTLRESGEPGLPGWAIFLDGNNNGTLDAGEINTVTDANGSFTFANNGPETYRVREVLQPGWVRTTANPADIVASSGTQVTGLLFGNRATATALPSFDFGTPTSPVAPGFRQVTPATTYSAAQGFGWLSGVIEARDYPTEPDPVKRDFNYTSQGVFGVDLANGTYRVTVTIGSAGFPKDQMGIFLEGTQVDSLTTLAGQILVKTYTATVNDRQLTLELRDLGGEDPFVVINGLEIVLVSSGGGGQQPETGEPGDVHADLVALLQPAHTLGASGSADNSGLAAAAVQLGNRFLPEDRDAGLLALGDLDPTLVDGVFADRSQPSAADPLAGSWIGDALFDRDLAALPDA